MPLTLNDAEREAEIQASPHYWLGFMAGTLHTIVRDTGDPVAAASLREYAASSICPDDARARYERTLARIGGRS